MTDQDNKTKISLTEALNPRSVDLDILSAEEIVRIMNQEDIYALNAVKEAAADIAKAIDDALSVIKEGGSLIYIGAGTSGRLGVLDASEMYPTFSLPEGIIKAIIAGGTKAVTSSVEGAEDDEEAGTAAINNVSSKDMLLGISASGAAPFVISALKGGKARGARCWMLTCGDKGFDHYEFLDGIISLKVGPEIIAGSSRLKAGTATKMTLNIISTTTMIKLGRFYKGYMVDVVPSNQKLKLRAIRIIQDITRCSHLNAEDALKNSGGNCKKAILMQLLQISKAEAEQMLERSEGSLRKALTGSQTRSIFEGEAPHVFTSIQTERPIKDTFKIIGLMSGTSHDGLDAALVYINRGFHSQKDARHCAPTIILKDHIHIPYDIALRNNIHDSFNGTTQQICRLNFELGEVFANGVLSILETSNISYKEIDCVASHGQTIYHIPKDASFCGSTLQIGESAIIAERTGIPVISDFRPRDMAAGGQGAPLVPMADWILFGKPDTVRAVLNIGGIANVTILRDSLDNIIAFDTGPGNSLIDETVKKYFKDKVLYDKDGVIARKGHLNRPLLETLLKNPYLKKTPPKSTGREIFGLDYAIDILKNNIENMPIEDIVATLTHFTAVTIIDAIFPFNPDEVILTGGGVYNQFLIELIRSGFREKGINQVTQISRYGIPPEAKEAVSFAILGYLTLNNLAGNVPSATGAQKSVILGKLTSP